MNSSWRDDSMMVGHPRRQDEFIEVSVIEFRLLQHIRSMEAGLHVMAIEKSARGRDGLQKFRVLDGSKLTGGG